MIGTTVTRLSRRYFVTCDVCGFGDSFDIRSSGVGAERAARAWQCPTGTCGELVRLRAVASAADVLVQHIYGCDPEDTVDMALVDDTARALTKLGATPKRSDPETKGGA